MGYLVWSIVPFIAMFAGPGIAMMEIKDGNWPTALIFIAFSAGFFFGSAWDDGLAKLKDKRNA